MILSGILHLIDWVTCMPRDCLQQNGNDRNVVWNCVLCNHKTEKKLDVIKNLKDFVLQIDATKIWFCHNRQFYYQTICNTLPSEDVS